MSVNSTVDWDKIKMVR